MQKSYQGHISLNVFYSRDNSNIVYTLCYYFEVFHSLQLAAYNCIVMQPYFVNVHSKMWSVGSILIVSSHTDHNSFLNPKNEKK